jgi:ech hydrogenase subunit A
MVLPVFLILFPLLTALTLLFTKNSGVRVFTVIFSFIILCVASIALAGRYIGQDMQFLALHSVFVDHTILLAEILLSVYVFFIAFLNKQKLVSFFVLIQSLPL